MRETQLMKASAATLSPVAYARLATLVQAAPQHMTHLYGLVDAAIDEIVYELIQVGLQADVERCETLCLYDGDPAIKYARYAPYVIRVPLENGSRQSALLERWLTEGWTAHWGFFLMSPLPLGQLKQHFKKFIQVSTPQGKKAWMRFYDPRVLPKLLTDLEPNKVALFFGKAVQAYFVPTASPHEMLRITFKQNSLIDRFSSMGLAHVDKLKV